MKNKLNILLAAFTLTLGQSAFCQSTKAKPTDKVIQTLQDSKKFRTVDLIKDPNNEFYLIKTEINGAIGYFVIDTGAYTTALSLEAAKALKLKLTKGKGSSYGIGGASKNYSSKIKSINFGETANIQNGDMKVINIPALSSGNYSGAHPIGILGSDFLGATGLILDFQTHKLYWPLDKKFKLKNATKVARYTSIKFIKKENVPTVSIQVGKRRTMKMVLDSGAKTTVIDLSAAKASKLKVTKSTRNLQGAGSKTIVAKTVYIPRIKLAGSSFSSFASTAMQLKEGVKNIDGIIGADLLFASGAIIDYGAKCVYTKKKSFKAYDIGLASKLPMSKKTSKALVSKATQIYDGRITALQPDGDMKAPNGELFKKIKFTFVVGANIKGNAQEKEKITFYGLIPPTDTSLNDLKRQIMGESERLVILDDSPVHKLTECLFKTSSVRTNQIKKLMKNK